MSSFSAKCASHFSSLIMLNAMEYLSSDLLCQFGVDVFLYSHYPFSWS